MAQGEMHASLKHPQKSGTFSFVLNWRSLTNMQPEHALSKPGDVSSIFLVKFSDRAGCRLLEDFNCNIYK